MFIKVHLPNNEILETPAYMAPIFGKSAHVCYNFTQGKPHKCIDCKKCCYDKVVEMLEDGTEVWVEFMEEEK